MCLDHTKGHGVRSRHVEVAKAKVPSEDLIQVEI